MTLAADPNSGKSCVITSLDFSPIDGRDLPWDASLFAGLQRPFRIDGSKSYAHLDIPQTEDSGAHQKQERSFMKIAFEYECGKIFCGTNDHFGLRPSTAEIGDFVYTIYENDGLLIRPRGRKSSISGTVQMKKLNLGNDTGTTSCYSPKSSRRTTPRLPPSADFNLDMKTFQLLTTANFEGGQDLGYEPIYEFA